MAATEQLGKEVIIHGREWNKFHGGYFSDPAIALPLLKTMALFMSESQADIIVDLGGGTGFLLSQMTSQGIGTGINLVNLDCSDAQLDEARQAGIFCTYGSIDTFRRNDITEGNKRIAFLMRSVLHYVGRKRLVPVLTHLRHQARGGELFVHQTASFEDAREAACLNALYRKMGTDKWYPTVGALQNFLAQAGWQVIFSSPAPALSLTSRDLGWRYGLDSRNIQRIRTELKEEFGPIENVLELTPEGFCASLHYHIYACYAGPANK